MLQAAGPGAQAVGARIDRQRGTIPDVHVRERFGNDESIPGPKLPTRAGGYAYGNDDGSRLLCGGHDARFGFVGWAAGPIRRHRGSSAFAECPEQSAEASHSSPRAGAANEVIPPSASGRCEVSAIVMGADEQGDVLVPTMPQRRQELSVPHGVEKRFALLLEPAHVFLADDVNVPRARQ